MMMTTTTTVDQDTLQNDLRQRIEADTQYGDAVADRDRIEAEQMRLQCLLDQELAAASDVENLVSKLETGEGLDSDDAADRVKILRDQIKAHQIAATRAEQRRKAVLRDVSDKVSAPMRAAHRTRCEAICLLLNELAKEIDRLPSIPAVLRSQELDCDPRDYPQFHFSELQQIRHKLMYFTHNYEQFLGSE